MHRINKIIPGIVMTLFTVLICGTIVQAAVNKESHLPSDEWKVPEARVQQIFNQGPATGIIDIINVTLNDIDPINMYQEVGSDRITKVVLGTSKENSSEYVFAIISSNKEDKEPSEAIVHVLPHTVGSNLRIVGVGSGKDFFLQNQEGNEMVYRIDWNSKEYPVSFLKSCAKRCG
ncbi:MULTISPECIES: hypothetical protein [unclassified Paenibacillus]|uniref:hypothetical protein n=1 Tax=unclassified Paenibacillus TaxID=185978 RepID=UPI001C0F8670|nr:MULTISPECIES: hypothetical protein [unclassified Paenibacillus]MBU5445508.1 hypothetical protein [Paenibacillus sp. MSJ-34]CAH0122367.1 hypothetical protein PAE9249_04917 [Paenibacillus sp. CECT 9249]